MNAMSEPILRVEDLSKRFTLHNQGGQVLPVLDGLSFDLSGGQCMALTGESGSGKSTLMRMTYGNYACSAGHIRIRRGDGAAIDVAAADPRSILALRRDTIGYVSQFLRVVPRVPALDIVAEPLRAAGVEADAARRRAAEMLTRLNVPAPLWSLSPTTFSGGEQQRVNLARGFAYDYPLLLLDEPTASLDAENRARVLDLIHEARARGAAILGIFHDAETREAVCNRFFDFTRYKAIA